MNIHKAGVYTRLGRVKKLSQDKVNVPSNTEQKLNAILSSQAKKTKTKKEGQKSTIN